MRAAAKFATETRHAHDADKQNKILNSVSSLLKVRAEDLPAQIEKILAEDKIMKKQIEEIQALQSKAEANKLLMAAKTIGAINFISGIVKAKDMDELREVADLLISKLESGVLILAAVEGTKVHLVAKADKKAVALGINAGKITKEISKIIGGGGGGRPDMAQAGGKIPEALPKMFDIAEEIVRNSLKA